VTSVPSGPDLLRQASAILAREAQRLSPTSFGGPPESPGLVPPGAPAVPAPFPDGANHTLPVGGIAIPPQGIADSRLKRQAGDLLAGLVSGLGRAPDGVLDKDGLRKQAHEFFETLLLAVNDRPRPTSVPTEDRVPLLQCEAPVQAGDEARAVLTVSNEEPTPSDVTLYCTNFVADSGHEVPALRVSFSPRRVTILAGAEATYQIRIAVPHQAAAGIYSGLIQAMGTRYVKAVLSMEVL
jgi:hypothetical protein